MVGFIYILLELSAYLLMQYRHDTAATLAKVRLASFVPIYVGFDSLIGIGTGVLIQYANRAPVDRLTILDPAINAFWTNQVANVFAIVGSIAWVFSMSMIAVAFTEPKRRPFVLIFGLIGGAIGGWAIQLQHSAPSRGG